MKTLIIHPKDKTTDFLSSIYDGKNYSVINYNITEEQLKIEIINHDRIIMLGHGCEDGLIGFGKLFIDDRYVYLLKNKNCIGIWCYANGFFEKHNLKGFYTGMIISEIDEAYINAVMFKFEMIKESNDLLSKVLRTSLETDDILSNTLSHYDSDDNTIVDFNKQNFYENR